MNIDYHSQAQKLTHPAKCYVDKRIGKVVVFYKQTGQLLRGSKYKEKHLANLLDTRSFNPCYLSKNRWSNG